MLSGMRKFNAAIMQKMEAVWWRNNCQLFFEIFSIIEISANYEKADHSLEYYKSLTFTFSKGN